MEAKFIKRYLQTYLGYKKIKEGIVSFSVDDSGLITFEIPDVISDTMTWESKASDMTILTVGTDSVWFEMEQYDYVESKLRFKDLDEIARRKADALSEMPRQNASEKGDMLIRKDTLFFMMNYRPDFLDSLGSEYDEEIDAELEQELTDNLATLEAAVA